MDIQDSIKNELREKLKQVLDEFIEILHGLYGFYYDAENGFQSNFIKAQSMPPHLGRIIAQGNPDDQTAIILNESTWNEIHNNNKKEGSNVEKARGYLLIMILEHWNHNIRGKIAKVLGIEDKSDLKVDIMGDLNKIRNDLLHSRGKANKSARGIKIKFKKSELIKITEEIFNRVFIEIFNYFNELALQETGSIMYLDRSLNQKAKDLHRSMEHICINPNAK